MPVGRVTKVYLFNKVQTKRLRPSRPGKEKTRVYVCFTRDIRRPTSGIPFCFPRSDTQHYLINSQPNPSPTHRRIHHHHHQMSYGLTDTKAPTPPKQSLKKVHRLEFTILVDNSIEWMTKMPPGFGSEIKGHLERCPPVDSERTGIPILDLDEYCCGGSLDAIVTSCYNEHSVHINLSYVKRCPRSRYCHRERQNGSMSWKDRRMTKEYRQQNQMGSRNAFYSTPAPIHVRSRGTSPHLESLWRRLTGLS